MTSSPTFKAPPMIRPANPLKSWCSVIPFGRRTYCTGKRKISQIRILHVQFLEMAEQGGALIPRHLCRSVHDVVAEQRADRDERDFAEGEPVRERGEVMLNLCERSR